MKKIFGALMIAICIAMAMPAQAQIHFGVKGGLNLSKASFSNVSENFKKDNCTGFFIGPMAEFNIPIVGLGVDASLLFAQRGIKVSEGNDDITVKQIMFTSDLDMKYNDGSKFTATLIDGQGKLYANQIIKFNVNGVFYNRVTDNNGIASLNIRLLPGKYIITSIWESLQIGNTITINP